MPQIPAHIKQGKMRPPPSNPWQEARDQIKGQTGKPTARLQCRSYPPGVTILIDNVDTKKETPSTLTDLTEGDHEVTMEYVTPSGEVISKKETVSLKIGRRTVCKMYFVEPKTLA